MKKIVRASGFYSSILFLLAGMMFCRVSLFAQNIGGIGAQLIIDTAGGYTMPRIFSLVPNSPAYDSLQATDYIIKVDGVSCKDKTIGAVVEMIRGAAGTPVKITEADTKAGANSREYTLIRVGMQLPSPPDPTIAFYARCREEAAQMKRKGATIIKAYNSEGGSSFFNFDAGKGQYHIRLLALADKSNGAAGGFYATAEVFASDRKGGATPIGKLESKSADASGIAQTEGTATFDRNCVGVVGISMHDDAKQCRAMYVMVYQ